MPYKNTGFLEGFFQTDQLKPKTHNWVDILEGKLRSPDE